MKREIEKRAASLGAAWLTEPLAGMSEADLDGIAARKPSRRERECLAAVGIAQSVATYTRENSDPGETAELSMPLAMLDVACDVAFSLLPALKKSWQLEEIGGRFDSMAEKIFKAPSPLTEYVDFVMCLLDAHLTRMKNQKRLADALGNVVSALYAIRDNYDPDREDISDRSGLAAVAWEVSS